MKSGYSIKTVLSKNLLVHLSTKEKKTDKEIAMFFGIDRTYISHLRKDYGIPSKVTTGRRGELEVIRILEEKGFAVEDLNLKDKTAPYDIRLDHSIKIEVKSAVLSEITNRFTFALDERRENGCRISDHRIELKSGRSKKVFSKTCDFIIFVCLKGNVTTCYIVPSNQMDETKGSINIPLHGGHFKKYRNNWEVLNTKKDS